LLKWMDIQAIKEKVSLHNCAVVKMSYDDGKFSFEDVIQNN